MFELSYLSRGRLILAGVCCAIGLLVRPSAPQPIAVESVPSAKSVQADQVWVNWAKGYRSSSHEPSSEESSFEDSEVFCVQGGRGGECEQ